jgi:DNA-binding response OmpR family regulator
MMSDMLKKQTTVFLCEANLGAIPALADYLSAKDFVVHCLKDSSKAIDEIITRAPDVVLLDTDLPMAGGYDVCGMVRPYYNGHILFTGKDGDDASQLLAFERGADDYVQMPVSPALLAARISAHLKRSRSSAGNGNSRQIRIGELVVDASLRKVSLSGKSIDLTTMQFELLWYLAKRSGRVVSRNELYEALYNEKYNGFDRSVDVYISRIRQQLKDNADNPSFVKTIRGVGYLFVGHDGRQC